MEPTALRKELYAMESRLEELSSFPMSKMPLGPHEPPSNPVDREWIARTHDRLYSALTAVRWARIGVEITYNLPDEPAQEKPHE